MDMSRILKSAALAALAAAGGPASAQQPVVTYPQGYAYYRPSAPSYRPAPGYYAARPADNRAVLPGFAPRGGIGTTPFLGNTRGLGGYSVNYDAAPRPAAARQARRGLFFRRGR
jgi:hypothetical protein